MNMKIIRVSKVAFDILFVVAALAAVLVLAATAFSPMIIDLVRDSGQTVASGTIMGIDVTVDASRLDESALTQVAYAVGTHFLALLVAGVYVAHQIRRALRAVLEGTAFRSENYQRLRRVAYAVFALVPVGWVTSSWVDTVQHGGLALSIDLPLATIGGGLLALAVAEIYQAGITLQDESELTV